MTDDEISAKFRDMARVHMSEARVTQLLEHLWTFDRQDDVAALAPLLAFDRT